jgi:small subunit ribosomal protein S13
MRIQGITLPDNKRLEIALTAIFGVGRSRAKKILDEVSVDHNKKTSDLTSEEENKIRTAVETFQIEGDLKRNTSSNIKRLKDINSYRGSRHAKQLPARGQRSKTNGRTVRGNIRKTMGSGKRSVDKK